MAKIKISDKTKKWWKAAGVRAIRTVAQTAVGVIGSGAILAEVDWKVTVSAAALAGITSILTSIAGLPEVATEGGIDNE